jgi:DNA-binding LytR/AlgR family response regulator
MLKCYIIDDETHALEILTKYIEQTPELTLIGFNTNPVLGVQEINTLHPDLVFMDIEMPMLSGTEASRLIQHDTIIVFTTAHSGFALQAFDLGSHDYLLKPIRYERFLQSVGRIRSKFINHPLEITQTESNHIFVQSGAKGQIVRVDLKEVFYIESLNNYIVIYTTHEKHIVYITLKEILSTLPEKQFERIHKSIIVNLDRIKSIEGSKVVVEDQTKLPIGNSYRDGFLSRISKNLVRKKGNE